jgi:hypothetical protein
MTEFAQNPYISDAFMKVMLGVGGSIFIGIGYLVKTSWNVSKKVAAVDSTLEAHAYAAENHAKADTDEFNRIAERIDSDRKEFREMWNETRSKYHEQNNSLQKLTTAVEVQNTRIEYIIKGIDEIKDQVRSR